MSAIESHPILSFPKALALETKAFGGDEAREWPAILAAGRGVADALLRDMGEVGGFPDSGTVLVLAGKGHNGADAIVAAGRVLELRPGARVEIVFVFGSRTMRPLTARAYREVADRYGRRVAQTRPGALSARYSAVLDGVFGLKFRTPLAKEAANLFAEVERLEVGIRAAVDVPSGLSEPGAFRADFTYATGSVKEPLLGCVNAGRPRYVPIGLVDTKTPGRSRVLVPSLLGRFSVLRPASVDKRKLGHLVMLGGSDGYPGAILMSALAAAHSGVGLVTAFVPQAVAASYAARLPEVMWVGWPTHVEGGLSVEGQELWEARIGRASAVIVGPGLGRSKETQALLFDLLGRSKVPWVMDADALMPELVRAGRVHKILTPHAGEFARIAEERSPESVAKQARATVILKGPLTRVVTPGSSYASLAGGPVLARGGSGDILSGLVGGLLAQMPEDPVRAACSGVLWHGMAADRLAQSKGQVAVTTTELIDHLGPVLRRDAR